MELKKYTLGHLVDVLYDCSTNSSMFCSFALQTLRGSVCLFYKLNVCSVRSIITWTWFSSLWLQKYGYSTKECFRHPCCLKGRWLLKRYFMESN